MTKCKLHSQAQDNVVIFWNVNFELPEMNPDF